MRLSWLTINRMIIGAGLLVAGATWFLPGVIVEWIAKLELVEDSGPEMALLASGSKEKKTVDNDMGRLTNPSVQDVVKASSIALRRMQPPKPAPPPEPPPVVATAPVEADLFLGSLIGVIRDSDPKYCYAMLKWPDNRIQLIAKGRHLTDSDDSPWIAEVNAESVTIEKGERKQTLDLRGRR